MYSIVISAGAAVSLFLGMLALLEVGRRLGVKRITADHEAVRAGAGAVASSHAEPKSRTRCARQGKSDGKASQSFAKEWLKATRKPPLVQRT